MVYTMSFGNGSTIVFDMLSAASGGAGTYYGPTGQLCGSMSYTNDSMIFTTPDGTAVEIRTESDGSMTMTCNGITTVTLTGSQVDALNNWE